MQSEDTPGYGAEAPVDVTRTSPPTPTHTAAAPEESNPTSPGVHAEALMSGPPSVTTDPARWGWRGRLGRATGGLINLQPGWDEARSRLAEVAARQHLGGARLVMVANPKGGSRVTTTVLLLAHSFAALRGGSVVAWDGNETRGTLADRAEITSPATHVWHLLAAFDRLASPNGTAGDLAYYLRSQPSRADVLASDFDPARREQISSAECARIAVLLGRYYRLTLLDTGNNMRAGNWQWAAQRADQLVVPIMLEPDVAASAAWMLDGLAAHGRGDLAAAAVTIVSPAATRPSPTVRARILDYFTQRTALVVEVPFDEQLAGGRPVVYARISDASRRAWVAAAAAVADGLAAVQRTRPDQRQPGPAPAAPPTQSAASSPSQRPEHLGEETSPGGSVTFLRRKAHGA